MKIKLHPEKLKLNLDTVGFVIDLLMIALVILNLGLILFDWLFQVPPVQGFLADMTPAFHAFYRDTIHSNFLFYDLCFVAVYLTEFVIRWIVAIARSTYHRWFFYPFAHWYDLLGCIPVGSFRWLRILRVVGLVMRLQRMGIIDLSQTWLGQTILKYYGIVVEEVSDRVVINVLSGAQARDRWRQPATASYRNPGTGTASGEAGEFYRYPDRRRQPEKPRTVSRSTGGIFRPTERRIGHRTQGGKPWGHPGGGHGYPRSRRGAKRTVRVMV